MGCKGTNAFTSNEQTVYINDIPANQLENWLGMESERFRKPVLRIFHTELEAVYEEKNRSLDNDDDKAFEMLFANLYPNHTYGTQTTIGTIDHLKNPSLKEINKYYNKYYVPNNMAIILSGDFNPDIAIKIIEEKFSYMQSKPIDPYKFGADAPIKNPIVKEVFGPKSESLYLAWKFKGGITTKDADMVKIVNLLLSNGKAGLMDLNLNQKQKVLSASGFDYPLNDYTSHILFGEAKEGQPLEEVSKLLLEQVDMLKKGEFPDWLLKAVITDLKYAQTKKLEENSGRAF
jgi:predicted Zn-dependent peptidase